MKIDIETYCKLELKDGIVHAHYAPNALIDLETAKRIVQARKELANHQPHPVLVTGGPIRVSADARRFAFTAESSELITSWAVVIEESLIKTTFYKLLFFTQNRKRKMRFFSNKENALNWIFKRQEPDFSDQFYR